ncbi:MAG: hypothetical protein ACOY3D_07260, partial [Candidatus Omnitrophota bacterium]
MSGKVEVAPMKSVGSAPAAQVRNLSPPAPSITSSPILKPLSTLRQLPSTIKSNLSDPAFRRTALTKLSTAGKIGIPIVATSWLAVKGLSNFATPAFLPAEKAVLISSLSAGLVYIANFVKSFANLDVSNPSSSLYSKYNYGELTNLNKVSRFAGALSVGGLIVAFRHTPYFHPGSTSIDAYLGLTPHSLPWKIDHYWLNDFIAPVGYGLLSFAIGAVGHAGLKAADKLAARLNIKTKAPLAQAAQAMPFIAGRFGNLMTALILLGNTGDELTQRNSPLLGGQEIAGTGNFGTGDLVSYGLGWLTANKLMNRLFSKSKAPNASSPVASSSPAVNSSPLRKLLLPALIFGALSLTAPALSQDNPAALNKTVLRLKTLMETSGKAFEKQDYAQAIKGFRQIVTTVDSLFGTTLPNDAQFKASLRQMKGAAQQNIKSVSLKQNLSRLNTLMQNAGLAFDQGKYDQAVKGFQGVITGIDSLLPAIDDAKLMADIAKMKQVAQQNIL